MTLRKKNSLNEALCVRVSSKSTITKTISQAFKKDIDVSSFTFLRKRVHLLLTAQIAEPRIKDIQQ